MSMESSSQVPLPREARWQVVRQEHATDLVAITLWAAVSSSPIIRRPVHRRVPSPCLPGRPHVMDETPLRVSPRLSPGAYRPSSERRAGIPLSAFAVRHAMEVPVDIGDVRLLHPLPVRVHCAGSPAHPGETLPNTYKACRIRCGRWVAANVGKQVQTALESNRIFAGKPADPWIVVSGSVVVEAGLRVPVPPRERIARRAPACLEVPPGAVLPRHGHRTEGVSRADDTPEAI
jgi:hypothetical protein